MKLIFENPLIDWYKYDVIFSFELLDSYIEGVEEQILKSIDEFSQKIESNDVINDEYPYTINFYGGIADDTFDLKGVFENYFPNLQRRSALITIYSFFEYELNKLCDRFTEHEKLSTSFKDVSGRGIVRAYDFLKDTVGLKIDKSNQLWQEMINIQKVRNLIVHNNSKLKDNKNKSLKAEIQYVKASESLNQENNEIQIEKDYLSHALNVFKEHCLAINRLIEERENNK